jgi:hypothetical protein
MYLPPNKQLGILALFLYIFTLLLSAAQASNELSINSFQMPNEKAILYIPSSPQLNWSLPINGRISQNQNSKNIKRLDASINLSDSDNVISHAINNLLDTAVENNQTAKLANNAVMHYRKPAQIIFAEGKDAGNYLIPYRGFGPSKEASDIILGEKLKLKSKASAELAKQKIIDETHIKIASSMMQIAMGVGMKDDLSGEQITSSGVNSLKELVGQQEAEKTLQMFSTLSKEINIPDAVFAQRAWDVTKRQDKLKTVLQTAIENDPVIHEIVKRLHKYNQKSKFSQVSANVIQTTLGAASLTPSFIGPAAKLALLSYIMATGGPEQCKLLKQLYLDKRFESRWKALNEESHLALENYQIAVLTKNPVLLACSEAIISEISDSLTAKEVLGTLVMPDKQKIAKNEQSTLN